MASPPAAQAVSPGRHRRRSLIVARRSRGDEAFLEQIFSDHHQEIYRYCLAIVRNRSDAEDALQATMSAAVRTLPAEEREIAIRPWLYRVAHNESVSIIRRRREIPSEHEVADAHASSAGELLEERERLRTLVSDLRALPDRQRSAIVMRELSGLSYEEIALALRCGEGAARQVVYEARSALATVAEGREMECEQARRAISDGDRRRLRGRKLKAHLSACEPCSDFRAAIESRERDLRALCPPVGVAAASGLLAGLIGAGGSGAGSAAAGGASVAAGAGAGGLAGGAALKGASLVAAAAIAVGAADISGVAELPGPLHIGGRDAEVVAPAESGPSVAADDADAAGGGATDENAPGKGAASAKGRGKNNGSKGGKGTGASGGGEGKNNGSKGDGTSPGNSGSAPGQQPVGSAPGNSGSSNAGGNPGAPGGGKGGSPSQAGGNPSPGPPATSPATPNTGNGSGGGTGPPANSNAGGQGKGNGTPGGGKDK